MWRLVAVLSLVSCARGLDAPSEAFIRHLNRVQGSWTAGQNFHSGSSVKNFLSALPTRNESLPHLEVNVKLKLPERFDSRKAWERCRTLGKVREQGNCASAWAQVAAAVFSDRLCVKKKLGGSEMSAQNILACCKHCGVSCLGGYLTDALMFLSQRGTPTRNCHPYEIFPCPKIQGAMSCPTVRANNPRCRGYCRASHSTRQPYMELRTSGLAYSLANSSDVIRSDIMNRGPVAAVIDVYEDFLTYRSGVYRRTAGSLLGQHPVKILGWGWERGTPYWLVANSWGPLWGDRGLVKIAQNSNGINLENRVFAVLAEPSQKLRGPELE